MISKANAMYARIAPRKARVVANLVRGKDVGAALMTLEFLRKSAASLIRKVIESALANARTGKSDANVDDLYVSKITVDKGPNRQMRRWRPRAMGRATRIVKGVSHIMVELDER
ncbi:MAG TPA: 50S ribosomal protein L22 [Polyangiaceae bacterium]|nr:50S ribosomal protein L22 [Polyangiaceae bacterium]HQM07885.1 50S ribosomal protein L22 [Polyangiaceae bacterium]